jgi:two-component system, sensor histidine kinase PdtaS
MLTRRRTSRTPRAETVRVSVVPKTGRGLLRLRAASGLRRARAEDERLLAERQARAELTQGLTDEIAHRVRNNLAMLSGLLHLQLLSQNNPEVTTALRAAIGRMHAFVAIHELARGTCSEQVDLIDALLRVATGAQQAAGDASGVEVAVIGAPRPCSACLATNLCVAANELLTNALLHAAPGPDGAPRVELEVAEMEGELHLLVRNTGQPVPPDFAPDQQAGMGLRLIHDLIVDQYRGRFTLRPWAEGSVAELVVPL